MGIDRDRGLTSDADREAGIDRDPNYSGDVTPGGNPAQDQPGFNRDAAADTYPTRDTTGASQGLNRGIDQGYGQTEQGYDPNAAQGPAYNPGVGQGPNQDPAYNPGVGPRVNQDPAYNPGVNQGLNQGPAYGSGMDQDVGAGGGAGSTDYDRDRDANGPGAGGGVGDAMQRARGKVEEAVGNMTNNPDLQQQGINRQAGGRTGYGAPDTDTVDTTGTTDTSNQGLTDETYGNP